MADKPIPTYASAQPQTIVTNSPTAVVVCRMPTRRAVVACFGGVAARAACFGAIAGASDESITCAVAGDGVTLAAVVSVPAGVAVVCTAACWEFFSEPEHWYLSAWTHRSADNEFHTRRICGCGTPGHNNRQSVQRTV